MGRVIARLDGDDGDRGDVPFVARNIKGTVMHTDQPTCVTNADFAELSAHGRTMAPSPEDPALAEFGPLGSPTEDYVWAGSDPLEAFCDNWGANAPSPAVAPFPSR